jgi:hypothetical protein
MGRFHLKLVLSLIFRVENIKGGHDIKFRFFLAALSIFLLPGCSLVDSLNHSLNYVGEATAYINNAAKFAENIPVLAEQAITNLQAREALKVELENMKENIINFNGIEAPGFAKEIHQKLISYNETLMTEINGYMEKINNNVLDYRSLIDSHIIQTISEMTQLLNQLQKLGQ